MLAYLSSLRIQNYIQERLQLYSKGDTAERLAPSIYLFVHLMHSSPSSLLWKDKMLSSSKGVQQGEPFGPLLFCLSVYHHSNLQSAEFCVEYLDNITLGGCTEEILHDLEVIESIEEGRAEIIKFEQSEVGDHLRQPRHERDHYLSSTCGSYS